MLRKARQFAGLVAVCASAGGLPYPDDCFDRILMVDALHHVSGQAQAVRELVRVLKPGGRLVIEEPDIQTRPVQWVSLAEKLAGMGSRFFTAAEGLALFQDLAGATHHHQQDYTTWWWFDKA
jgi:demethylmenaquinone methyltransferase/2-methoxy-6-polyprenyl-1,4-benzoquinol methylase